MFFKLILEGGHLGAGKSYDIVRYLKGRDIVSVLTWAFHIPRAKKKETGKGVKLINAMVEGLRKIIIDLRDRPVREIEDKHVGNVNGPSFFRGSKR